MHFPCAAGASQRTGNASLRRLLLVDLGFLAPPAREHTDDGFGRTLGLDLRRIAFAGRPLGSVSGATA